MRGKIQFMDLNRDYVLLLMLVNRAPVLDNTVDKKSVCWER